MTTTASLFADRLAVSVLEAAVMLGIKPKTIYNQISAGCCPVQTVKFGGRRMVLMDDLRAFTARQLPEPAPGLNRHSARRR